MYGTYTLIERSPLLIESKVVHFILWSAEWPKHLTSPQHVVHMCADEREKMTWGRGSCLSSNFKRVSAENNEVDVRKKNQTNCKPPHGGSRGATNAAFWAELYPCNSSPLRLLQILCVFCCLFSFFFKPDRLCAYVADAGFRFQMGLCSRTLLVWPHGGYLKNWFAASQHEDQILDNTGNCLATSAAAQHAVNPLSRAPSALNSCIHVQKTSV